MPQLSPVSTKPETQATPATKKAEHQTAPSKAEPTPVATKSQPTPDPIKAVPTVPTPKAKMEPTSIKMEITARAASAQIKADTTLIPTARVSPIAAEKQPLAASIAESIIPTMAPVATPKVEVPNADVPKTITVGNKEEAVKKDLSETEFSKPDYSKIKDEAGVAAALSFPVNEVTLVPTSPIAAEVVMAGVVPETETKPELSAPEIIVKEEQPYDHIKLTDTAKSLQQVVVQPKSQERQLVLEVEPIIAADRKEEPDKLVEKIFDVTSTPDTQPVSTKNIIIKVRMLPFD